MDETARTEGPTSTATVHSRMLLHEYHLSKLSEQLVQQTNVIKEMRLDLKTLLTESEREKARGALYDAWVRRLPVILALVSGGYYLLTHLGVGHG